MGSSCTRHPINENPQELASKRGYLQVQEAEGPLKLVHTRIIRMESQRKCALTITPRAR